jgi:hypothetical protein
VRYAELDRHIKRRSVRTCLSSGYDLLNHRSLGCFGAGVNKSLWDHLDESAFIDADVFAARASHFVAFSRECPDSADSILVAPQDFSWSDFSVFPQLGFAGRTSDEQHGKTVI